MPTITSQLSQAIKHAEPPTLLLRRWLADTTARGRVHATSAGRSRRRLIAAALALITLVPAALTACGHPPDSTPKIIVVAASATANEPAPVLSSADRDLLGDAGATSTRGIAYVIDPTTGQAIRQSLTPRLHDGQVDYGPDRSHLLSQNVNLAQKALEREAAARPFDLLAWVAQALRAAPGPGTLLILSSGLSTAGGFDLRKVGWGADPQLIAAQLKRSGLLPDLAGWRVIFSGLGDTAGRQPALPLPQRTELAAYWRAICIAAGAASCALEETTRPDPPSRSTTPVPIVPVPRVQSVRGPHGRTRTIVPADEFFAFNRARLIPGADIVLGPLAAKARAQRTNVSITGYSSPDGGTNAYNEALSRRRAAAVAARLRLLGIPARQIVKITGEGTAGKPRSVCYRHGYLDKTVCARYRRVVILLSPPAAAGH